MFSQIVSIKFKPLNKILHLDAFLFYSTQEKFYIHYELQEKAVFLVKLKKYCLKKI